MDTVPPYPQSEPSNDIFSLSDDVLSECLEFIYEIGFGNWGSVWLCRPRPAKTSDGKVRPLGQKIAVKVVHRSKTSTTAARVRSLWNEMKIIKSLKSELHPAIIPFYSFIITPSYALITMSYLPTLVPVEVEESKASKWFRFLLSGVEFLHTRGVVHNDIKPANILVSHKNIPVLVDFGFAEKYDLSSDTAFHSNLSYGTPEYLSPERARGLSHDTRKSDVWSLGVTFFEILIGRTPFERSDGEQFHTKEDLEKYWGRTLRGKWVGTWDFSKDMERLLQRMMSPNADLRFTAKQAMSDAYWQMQTKDVLHKRSSSYASTTSSVVFEKDEENLIMTPSSWKGVKDKKLEKPATDVDPQLSPVLDVFLAPTGTKARGSGLTRSKSQPRVAGVLKAQHGRKRGPAPLAELSPIKASPNPSPMPSPAPFHVSANSSGVSASTKAKENISNFNKLAATVESKKKARTPFGALNVNGNARPTSMITKKPSGQSYGAKAIRVLGELPNMGHDRSANLSCNYNVDASFDTVEKSKDSTNVKDRMKDWERERERLREMTRLEEMERESVELHKRQKREKKKQKLKERALEKEKQEKEDQEQEKEEQDPQLQLQLQPQEVEQEDTERRSEDQMEREQQREEKARIIERKSASHLYIGIPGKTTFSERTNPTNDIAFSRKKESKTMHNKDWEFDKENICSSSTSPVLPMFRIGPSLTQAFNISMDTPPPPPSASNRPAKGTGKGSIRHSIKASIDKTIEFCKSASITSGRSTPARGFSFDVIRPLTKDYKESSGKDARESTERDEQPSSEVVSPLPIIKNAAESQKMAADARMDGMTIWMRNVDKLVEEVKQNFASASAPKELPLPSLPPPLSRTPQHNRSRLPRRVLAASQIFQSDENGNITPLIDQSMVSNNNSTFLTADDIVFPLTPAPVVPAKDKASIEPTNEVSDRPAEETSQFQIPEIHTPSRQKRRATVSVTSPVAVEKLVPAATTSEVGASPSKRREKSKSHSDLLNKRIVPIALLEAEINKTPPPQPTPRLSQVIDRNLFIAPPLRTSRDDLLDSHSVDEVRQPSFDELTSSPYRVEPYPQRQNYDVPVLDTPSRHRLEGVYDRFLMATSGVKRVGKGYQSDIYVPVANNKNSSLGLNLAQKQARAFYSTRRPMPPPVSSEDLERRTASVDELGNWSQVEETPEDPKDSSVGFVRKAIKLMVPKGTTSKRLSRIA